MTSYRKAFLNDNKGVMKMELYYYEKLNEIHAVEGSRTITFDVSAHEKLEAIYAVSSPLVAELIRKAVSTAE